MQKLCVRGDPDSSWNEKESPGHVWPLRFWEPSDVWANRRIQTVKSETKLLRGLVDPGDYSEDELIVMSLRVPKRLVENVDTALDQFSTMISDREEFLLTTVAYALCCIEEQQRRARNNKKRSIKTRPSTSPES